MSDEELERRVLGFFVAKGLLIDPLTHPLPRVKLDIRDVIQVADKVEPRVFEVLPAALIHFPESFMNLEALPAELAELVDAVRRGEERTDAYKGIHYRDMKRWADSAGVKS